MTWAEKRLRRCLRSFSRRVRLGALTAGGKTVIDLCVAAPKQPRDMNGLIPGARRFTRRGSPRCGREVDFLDPVAARQPGDIGRYDAEQDRAPFPWVPRMLP